MRRLALAVVLVAGTAAAQPDPKSNATAEAESGQKLYAQNDFAGAASHFVHAYELDPQPAYLFDAAQAYRFAKDCVNAAKYFKQFIEVAQQAQAKNLDKVKKYLAEEQACANEHPAPKSPPPKPVTPPPSPSPSPSPQPLTLAPTLTPTSSEPRPEAEPDRGQTKRRAGIVVAGAGGGVLLLGVLAQHWSGTVESDRNAFAMMHCTPSAPCEYAALKQLDDKGHRDAEISATAYTIGAAAVATGIALYVLGRHESGEQQVTVAPTSNGASVSFRF